MEEERYIQFCLNLIRQWAAKQMLINPGTTEKEIKKFERELQIQLPQDFKHFYSLANGMNSDYSIQYMFSLWPLEKILQREDNEFIYIEKTSSKIEIAFADWLEDAHRYYLILDNYGNTSIETEEVKNPKLADTFAEFLELYFLEPNKLRVFMNRPKRKTGILDIDEVEICQDDVIESDLGSKYLIFWDHEKKSLMAKPLDKYTEANHQLMIESFGNNYLNPIPFQGTNNIPGFAFSYKIIKRS